MVNVKLLLFSFKKCLQEYKVSKNAKCSYLPKCPLLIKLIFPCFCIEMTSTCLFQISGTSCDFFSLCQSDRLLITRATWSFLIAIHRDIFILMSFFPSHYLVFSQKSGCRSMLKRFYSAALQFVSHQLHICDSLLSKTYGIFCVFLRDYCLFYHDHSSCVYGLSFWIQLL